MLFAGVSFGCASFVVVIDIVFSWFAADLVCWYGSRVFSVANLLIVLFSLVSCV